MQITYDFFIRIQKKLLRSLLSDEVKLLSDVGFINLI